MRTRLGEIRIVKVIIALLLIIVATIGLSRMHPGDAILYLPFEAYFFGFFLYIVFWIIGFFVFLWGYRRKVLSEGDEENILKIKKEGYFIYNKGSGWNPKKDECRHLNTNFATSMDRLFYTSGPPFGEAWDFESGVVHWFGMTPLVGFFFLVLWVVLPLSLIFYAYNFFW